MRAGTLERVPLSVFQVEEARSAAAVPQRPGARTGRGAERPLVTSRNNSYLPWWGSYDTPFRAPRAYVQKCAKGTLALLLGPGRVTFTALTCSSWSCPSCRKVLAAQLLERLRGGMESRAGHRRTFVTLTLDPAHFGAVPIGTAYWDAKGDLTAPHKAIRRTKLWSQPSAEQFKAACEAMSREWNKLNMRLVKKCRTLDVQRCGYFRVVELHRNGWPHYHVVLEHPTLGAGDIHHQVAGWDLGITNAQEVSLDDAVGELAPYLCSPERKGNGSKAYQFAATALPEGFRLHSSSRGFLAPVQASVDAGTPEHSFPVRGHFTAHHETVRAWGGDARIALRPVQPEERPHKAPASSVCTGEQAERYYHELLSVTAVYIPPEELKSG